MSISFIMSLIMTLLECFSAASSSLQTSAPRAAPHPPAVTAFAVRVRRPGSICPQGSMLQEPLLLRHSLSPRQLPIRQRHDCVVATRWRRRETDEVEAGPFPSQHLPEAVHPVASPELWQTTFLWQGMDLAWAWPFDLFEQCPLLHVVHMDVRSAVQETLEPMGAMLALNHALYVSIC